MTNNLTGFFDKCGLNAIEQSFGGVKIRRDDVTGMFNANDLISAYKLNRPNTLKSTMRYTDNETTKEFIDALTHREGIPVHRVISTKRGLGGGTWMHPYLFVDFAMWLSPEFKYVAIKWIYDNLYLLPDASGKEFEDLNATINETLSPDKACVYSNECRMLKGLAEDGSSNEKYVDRLNKLKAADIKLLKQGVKNYNDRKKKLIEFANLL